MKRTLFIAIALYCTLSMAAQSDLINVKSKGAKLAISDFANALIMSYENEDSDLNESLGSFANAWKAYSKGKRLPKGTTITVDTNNGYICYESKYDNDLLRMEMCFWNENDKRHKTFAYTTMCYSNGIYRPGQYDGIYFYRYDSANKKMSYTTDMGYIFEYSDKDNSWISYSLPRAGKDIIATTWHKNGKKQKTIKWNGHGFAKVSK